jgi:hypothetical protein
MESEHTSPSLVVGRSPALGIRGVIAGRYYKKRECIERCPVLLIPIEQYEIIAKTIFDKYIFEWTSSYDALALGYGSLYNHSYNANCIYRLDYKNKLISIYAVEVIRAGQEITINYNRQPGDKTSIEDKYVDYNEGR